MLYRWVRGGEGGVWAWHSPDAQKHSKPLRYHLIQNNSTSSIQKNSTSNLTNQVK